MGLVAGIKEPLARVILALLDGLRLSGCFSYPQRFLGRFDFPGHGGNVDYRRYAVSRRSGTMPPRRPHRTGKDLAKDI